LRARGQIDIGFEGAGIGVGAMRGEIAFGCRDIARLARTMARSGDRDPDFAKRPSVARAAAGNPKLSSTEA